MLFNSYEFILGFLPGAVAGFFLLGRFGLHRLAIAWLAVCSLGFYGWWSPIHVPLILASILFNFGVGQAIGRHKNPDGTGSRFWLTFGVVSDLALLIYFKYTNFLVDNVNALTGLDYYVQAIILPLGISFFTFTQIAYLVDTYQGKVREYSPVDYALFVTYFPHLIAGPVLHHKEMMPQFRDPAIFRPRAEDIAIGLTIFIIGLFKKTILADGIAPYAAPVFASAEAGEPIRLFAAWGGALAYTFQLYFDFSGYSDMAIGASRLLGIKLPLNFDSPYKSANISEFWRHWHMTLSRFLRDYLYIALGGNRYGEARRYTNLMITMALGGIWHGAGWTFLIWGILHGTYLCINHGWMAFRRRYLARLLPGGHWSGHLLACGITFLAVVIGWVFFRAQTVGGALFLLGEMFGRNGISLPAGLTARLVAFMPSLAGSIRAEGTGGAVLIQMWIWITVCGAIAFLAPNTQQLMAAWRPALDVDEKAGRGLLIPAAWRPNGAWAGMIALLAAAGILSLPEVTEFIYFQF